jgi:hypothetical protein
MIPRRLLLATLPLLAVLAVGCAHSTHEAKNIDDDGEGLFPSDAAHQAKAKIAIQKRLKFDMDCDSVQLALISDVTHMGTLMTSMSYGATGCGKKASYYVECVSNWGDITCNARPNTNGQAK